ncbi:MAG: FAD-dependent oxidoreductase, partial [Nitrospira sp.]|nr:FAD-dependent oxidoreductase [Nitrospira sp.]
MQHYDFVVIGSGPAGQKGAIQASKLGHSVALVEKHSAIGGACLHTGTIPSKTLREAALYLSGWHQRGFYGRSYRVKSRITAEDLMQRLEITTRHEIEVVQHQLHRNRVETFNGTASFVDPHHIEVTAADGTVTRLGGDRFLIATGSRPVQT